MRTDSKALETEKVGKLLAAYAVPSIMSGLVTSIYNIVDQIFIGNSVGMLGNAATNVAFPIVTLCTAISIMSGVGCAAGFNMAEGHGEKDEAGRIVGNTLVFMVFIGVAVMAVVLLFLSPILWLFGTTENSFPYAETYLGITAIGIPFSIFGSGGGPIVRSDGSPTYALVSILSGAVLNVGLDALFIFGFGWGIAGAAWATVIGQIVTAFLIGRHYSHFHTVVLVREYFRPRLSYIGKVIVLGFGPLVNHLSLFFVQIMLNNALRKYGAASVYGSDVPLACVGVITKLNTIFTAIVIGIAQGVQPVISHNYGAGNYRRVREAALKAIGTMLVISFAIFFCCQLFPRQLVSVFGKGTEEYYQFAARYLRIFMMLICVNGLQITAGNIFTSVGKPMRSAFISIIRQIVLLPVLLVFLPMRFGIDGILYSGPIADGACVIVAVLMLLQGQKELKALSGN